MMMYMGFPGSSDGKDSACNAGDLGSIPGSGRSPREGNRNPLQYSCLENPHGQRNLAGYSPWGRKVLDMTELMTLSLPITIPDLLKTHFSKTLELEHCPVL